MFTIFGSTDFFEYAKFGDNVYRRPREATYPDDQSGWRWECTLSHWKHFQPHTVPDFVAR